MQLYISQLWLYFSKLQTLYSTTVTLFLNSIWQYQITSHNFNFISHNCDYISQWDFISFNCDLIFHIGTISHNCNLMFYIVTLFLVIASYLCYFKPQLLAPLFLTLRQKGSSIATKPVLIFTIAQSMTFHSINRHIRSSGIPVNSWCNLDQLLYLKQSWNMPCKTNGNGLQCLLCRKLFCSSQLWVSSFLLLNIMLFKKLQ